MTPTRMTTLLRAGPAGVLAVIGVCLLVPDVARTLAWLPALISLLVFGLAHGAVDHHVPARLGDARATTRRRLVVGYVALVGAVALAFAQAPLVAWWAFLGLSVAHWAQGEGWAWRAAGHPAFGTPAAAVAWAAARGLLPIAGPLVAHPATAAELSSALPGVGSAAALGAGPRTVLLVVLVAAVGVSCWVTVRARAERPAWRAEAGELLVLAAGVALVPPLLLVGTYFLCWHSPRHIARLVAGDPRQAAILRARGWPAALRAFHLEALPCTLVALGGLVAALVAVTATGATAITAVALAVIAALTLPHAGVVAWMDTRQGVWTVRRPGAQLWPDADAGASAVRRDERPVAQAPAPA